MGNGVGEMRGAVGSEAEAEAAGGKEEGRGWAAVAEGERKAAEGGV